MIKKNIINDSQFKIEYNFTVEYIEKLKAYTFTYTGGVVRSHLIIFNF